MLHERANTVLCSRAHTSKFNCRVQRGIEFSICVADISFGHHHQMLRNKVSFTRAQNLRDAPPVNRCACAVHVTMRTVCDNSLL